MLKKLFSRLTASTLNPSTMRLKQGALILGLVLMALVLVKVLLSSSSQALQEEKPPERKEVAKLNTPFEAVNPRDVWVNRVQTEADDAKAQAKAVREENKLLLGRMETLEKLFSQGSLRPGEVLQEPPSLSDERGSAANSKTLLEKKASALPKTEDALSPPSSQKPLGASLKENSLKGGDALFGDASARLFHAGLPEETRVLLKNTNNYIPAGSYVQAVLTSGVVASTALQSSSQPQPIVMRLVGEGKLPRGFQSIMKDNVLIGACYGDLSSERVMCRLESMSWVDDEGLTIEKKVEGWLIGEDGRPGLRGQVVDRAGEAVRNSLLSGLLSGFSGFFKNEATSSVYPVSPFGQTNALKGQQALKGAAGTGASNALDRLAEFYIKRAEQMQPVILITAGRVVDVVFKAGVDIRPEVAVPSLTMIDQKQNSENGTQSSKSAMWTE